MLYVCSLITQEQEEQLSLNFWVAPGSKMEGHGQRPENWHFLFLERLAGTTPLRTDWALGTGNTGIGETHRHRWTMRRHDRGRR